MAADPTNELMRSLADPTKWEVRRGVPVFRAHERSFPERRLSDGTVLPAETVRVTDADLQGYADRLNATIRDAGQLPPLTVGHRQFDPNFPERLQPELTGFGMNYRVETVHRDGESFRAVVHDEYTPRDKVGVYRQYPYRSVDFHPAVGIVGVAMLLRPPELKLGTVYSYAARGVVTYQMEAVMAGEATPASDWNEAEDAKPYAAFCRYMKKYSAEAGAAAGPANATPPAPVCPPAGYQAPAAAAVTPPAVPPVATPAPAAATTPALPYQAGTVLVVTADGRVVPQAQAPAAANPVQVAQYAADTARMAAEMATLRQRLDQEQAARVRAECQAMLDPLRQVVNFEYQRELNQLVGLADPAARAAHVKYMADHYARLPSGGFIPVYQGSDHLPQPAPRPGEPPAAPKGYAEIMAYMTSHPGMSYDQAEAAVLAKAAK